MNYKRIEWIFLIAFLLLNFYLASILYTNNKETKEVTEEKDVKIEAIMKRENIKYHHSLSDKHREGSYMSADTTDLSEDKKQIETSDVQVRDDALVCTLKKPLKLSRRHVEKQIDDFIENRHNVVNGNDYEYLPEASTSKKALVYAQHYNGIPIYDMTAEITFMKEQPSSHDEELISYRQQHINHMSEMRDKSELISEKDAIYTLYLNSRLSSGDTIQWIKLAYTKVLSKGNTNVYVPTWVVKVHSTTGVTEVEKVNAISNRLMSPNNNE